MLRPVQNTENLPTNKRKYHLHIDLDVEYKPLHKKNTSITLSNLQKDCVRQSGGKHIDVWADGKIYPVDPTTMCTPNFSNATTLLKFARDGNTGLLGYCHNLLGDKLVSRKGQSRSTTSKKLLLFIDRTHSCGGDS